MEPSFGGDRLEHRPFRHQCLLHCFELLPVISVSDEGGDLSGFIVSLTVFAMLRASDKLRPTDLDRLWSDRLVSVSAPNDWLIGFSG